MQKTRGAPEYLCNNIMYRRSIGEVGRGLGELCNRYDKGQCTRRREGQSRMEKGKRWEVGVI